MNSPTTSKPIDPGTVERLRALDHIGKLGEWLGFSASCIKSGESWSPTCDRLRDEARIALSGLSEILTALAIPGDSK